MAAKGCVTRYGWHHSVDQTVNNMRPLYPMPLRLPSLLLRYGTMLLLLSACEPEKPSAQASNEPWPNEAEALFQEAAALRYTLEQQKLEEQRLQTLGVGSPSAAHNAPLTQ